jgi:hypothetical protein
MSLKNIRSSFSCFQLILNFIDENSWTFGAVGSRDQTVEALAEIEPALLVESVFDQYMTRNDDGATFSLVRFVFHAYHGC